MLALLLQKGELSHERHFGSSLDPLSFGVTSDKWNERSSIQLLCVKNLELRSLNNANEDELMTFYSDFTHLCLDSCITGGIAGVNSDFIEGLHAEVLERSSYNITGKVIVIGEEFASWTLKDDNVELCTLKTHMAHVPSSKFRLMAPQWLRIQERKQRVPKEKLSQWNIDYEDEVLLFHDRTK